MSWIPGSFYSQRIGKGSAAVSPIDILNDIKEYARSTGDADLAGWIERNMQSSDGIIPLEPLGRAMRDVVESFNARALEWSKIRAKEHEESVRASISRAKEAYSTDKGSISVTGEETDWVKRVTGTRDGQGSSRYEGVFEKFDNRKYRQTDIIGPYGTVYLVATKSGKKKRHHAYVLSPLGAYMIASSDNEYWADEMLRSIQNWLPEHRRHYTFDLDHDMGY